MKKAIAFIGVISAIFTILGFSIKDILNVRDDISWYILISLLCVIILLCFLLILSIWKKSRKTYPQGYKSISTFASYSTTDGKHIKYEIFKHIQVKEPYMQQHRHEYFWTGKNEVKVNSKIQKVAESNSKNNKFGRKMKSVILHFQDILIYDQPEIIHIEMLVDDDISSEPILCLSVEHPINFIRFDVELLHVNDSYYNKIAEISRQKINEPVSQPEKITELKFDTVTKSYSWHKIKPEVGYNYTIRWEKF